MRRAITIVSLCTAMLGATGCFGTYSNARIFAMEPTQGMQELALVHTYGMPDWSSEIEDSKVYVYRVRDNRYVVLVGLYEGYDLIVTCRDGEVADVRRMQRPKALTVFQPLPWAESN